MAATGRGLSSAEAVRHLAADGPNLLPGSAPKSSAAIVRGALTEPMFLMLLAAGGIYLALSRRAEALSLWASCSCSWSSASPSCRSAGRSGRSNRYSAQAAALNMALITRKPQGVIHHSDQGSQYTSLDFGKRCKEMGVQIGRAHV